MIEKADQLPYETAKRVINSNWYIHLQTDGCEMGHANKEAGDYE